MVKKVLWGVGIVVGGGVAVLALLRIFSPGPGTLGVIEGKLARCPASSNCVCSCDHDDPQHHVAPLRYEGDAEDAWARLKEILAARPRTEIVAEEEHYLRAECVSLLFRYVDDLEFLLDPEEGVIHVRSASRAGNSDLGVNRRRVEEIRAALGGGS